MSKDLKDLDFYYAWKENKEKNIEKTKVQTQNFKEVKFLEEKLKDIFDVDDGQSPTNLKNVEKNKTS